MEYVFKLGVKARRRRSAGFQQYFVYLNHQVRIEHFNNLSDAEVPTVIQCVDRFVCRASQMTEEEHPEFWK
jgi:hypothetical protein